MSINMEWRRRIERWRDELPKHFYISCGSIELQGFITREFRHYSQIKDYEFKTMPCGTPWGSKWEYGYFRGNIVIPQSCKGKKIVYKPDAGGEGVIYVNGRAKGAKDKFHYEITLTESAVPGDKYEVFIETYAGHGERNGHAGPTPPGVITMPEPPIHQCVVGQNSFGIWNDEIFRLWIDVSTLLELRDNIDHESLRAVEIDRYLKEFTTIVDFELPYEEFLTTVSKACKHLRTPLQCKNGSTSPVMYMFGHSHLDVAWKWPIAETKRKIARTFSNQLSLLEEYPEYLYLNSQPYLYELLKVNYPDIYERVKEEVKKGRVIPEGGMYVEADTNLTGGESLIRQFIYGKRFFKEEFGVDNEMCWLPDVFGYSASLPQIMKGCGIKYFTTSKILWAYNGGDVFPYITFYWKGLDGTSILSHNHNEYNAHSRPAFVINGWKQMQQKDGLRSRIFPFGYGDGGGGALREHLEFLRNEEDLEGMPKTKLCSPNKFFHDLEKDLENGYTRIPEYCGELYLQAHRGTYTTQAKTKLGNRKSEYALRDTELWACCASVIKHEIINKNELDELWKTVLVNQFHDILPGSSIQRVYEEAEKDYEKVLTASERLSDLYCSKLVNGEGYTIFNSLGWERSEVVKLPQGIKVSSITQHFSGYDYALVHLPSCGWESIESACTDKDCDSVCHASENTLENDMLKLEFDRFGSIICIYDKATGNMVNKGKCNALKMYKDVPTMFDAWDIDSMYTLTPVELKEEVKIIVLAQGPLFAKLSIERIIGISKINQIVTICKNSRRIDFETVVDWKESHKMLKVDFAADVISNESLHEIQFGYIARPNHCSRQYDADRFEVCSHKWTALTQGDKGAAVINDCKYGVSVKDNVISLTLLRSPLVPDMYADKGIQKFTYAFYCWNGAFEDSGLVREAYKLNIPAVVRKGSNSQRVSVFSTDSKNIVIESVKPAEDQSGDIIIRLYDSLKMSGNCNIYTCLPVREAFEADMLENVVHPLRCENGTIELATKPFEIKTIRLKIDRSKS